MLAKGAAHKVEGHRIGAAVGEGHAVGNDAQHMPKGIVILLGGGPAGERRAKKVDMRKIRTNIEGVRVKHP